MTMTFKHATAITLASLVAVGTVQAGLLEDVEDREKLIVGVKNDYKPFGYLNEFGDLEGFEVDLARAVARNMLGSEDALEMIPVVASNRIELLNAGRVDVIFATLGVNDNRSRVIDFTESYYDMAGLVLLAPIDTKINNWEELEGRKVCGSQGNLYNRTLTEKYNAEMMLYTDTAGIFNSFKDGRCEAIAFDGPILQMKVNEPGWKGKYKIALDTLEMIPIAGGVRKGEDDFLNAINNAIVEAEAEGVLLNAEKKYNMGQTQYVIDRAEAAKEN